MVDDDKNHERYLKTYVSDHIYGCIRKFYKTGKFGYLTIVGGEAINLYLSKEDKLDTLDYDLKFVVNPQFVNKEKDLLQANALRLRIITSLMRCLQDIKSIGKYSDVHPKLAILIHQKPRLIYVDDNKLFVVDPHTGEEKFIHYNFNKVFKILLYYRYDGGELKSFELVDLTLFYPHVDGGYSFFQKGIYDSFLKEPFNNKIPVPFIVRDNLRIPTLPYLIMDNFRMALITLDNLSVIGGQEDEIVKWKDKLSRYWLKVNKMKKALGRKNSNQKLDNLIASMKTTFDLYEPLAFLNSLCYREGNIYTMRLQPKKECDETYLKKLDIFLQAYKQVSKQISQLSY